MLVPEYDGYEPRKEPEVLSDGWNVSGRSEEVQGIEWGDKKDGEGARDADGDDRTEFSNGELGRDIFGRMAV